MQTSLKMINENIIQGFILLCIIFIPLERLFYYKKYSLFRKGFVTDLIYFFTGHIIGNIGLFLVIGITFIFREYLLFFNFGNMIDKFPSIVQFIIMIFLGEIGYYFIHRMFHENPFLWRFHAIHHSTEYLDWLATTRFHCFDQICTKIVQFLPFYLLNFPLNLIELYVLWSASMAFFIHGNLRFNFGILNYILVTPNLHQWHHDRHIINVNYGAQLSCFDLIFKTWYLPEKNKPQKYGIKEKISNNYLSQLIYPFRQWFGKTKEAK